MGGRRVGVVWCRRRGVGRSDRLLLRAGGRGRGDFCEVGTGVGVGVGVVLVEETDGGLEAPVMPRLGSELLFINFER